MVLSLTVTLGASTAENHGPENSTSPDLQASGAMSADLKASWRTMLKAIWEVERQLPAETAESVDQGDLKCR